MNLHLPVQKNMMVWVQMMWSLVLKWRVNYRLMDRKEKYSEYCMRFVYSCWVANGKGVVAIWYCNKHHHYKLLKMKHFVDNMLLLTDLYA